MHRHRRRRPRPWAVLLAAPRAFPPPWVFSAATLGPRYVPDAPSIAGAVFTLVAHGLAQVMTQVATITWTDPTVGAGQAALASLTVYAALDTDGNAGPLVELGSVAPGVQTFTTAAGQLTSGAMYYFCVKAVDVNGLVSQQSGWAGPLGPVGGPSPPTNVQATLGGS